MCPIYRNVALEARKKFLCNNAKIFIPHNLDCGLILSEGVIKRYLILRQPLFLPSLTR